MDIPEAGRWNRPQRFGNDLRPGVATKMGPHLAKMQPPARSCRRVHEFREAGLVVVDMEEETPVHEVPGLKGMFLEERWQKCAMPGSECQLMSAQPFQFSEVVVPRIRTGKGDTTGVPDYQIEFYRELEVDDCPPLLIANEEVEFADCPVWTFPELKVLCKKAEVRGVLNEQGQSVFVKVSEFLFVTESGRTMRKRKSAVVECGCFGEVTEEKRSLDKAFEHEFFPVSHEPVDLGMMNRVYCSP